MQLHIAQERQQLLRKQEKQNKLFVLDSGAWYGLRQLQVIVERKVLLGFRQRYSQSGQNFEGI